MMTNNYKYFKLSSFNKEVNGFQGDVVKQIINWGMTTAYIVSLLLSGNCSYAHNNHNRYHRSMLRIPE